MKKALANKIAKHWNENFAGHTEATRPIAKVSDGNVYIYPTAENDGRCFYHVEEFADVMRCFKVSGLICKRDTENEENVVVARLF